MANELEPITITEEGADGTQTEFEITTAEAPEGALGDDIVTALFDDGTATSEVSYADIDGDGSADVGAADTDGDGQLDRIAGDTDGDGTIDAAAADTDGDGNLDVIAVDTDADGQIDAVGEDTDGDGSLDLAQIDTDGDGEFDTELSDTDGDGEFEEVSLADEEGLPSEEELSTNSVEFTVGEDGFPVTEPEMGSEYTGEYAETVPVEYGAAAGYDAGVDPVFGASDTAVTDTGYSTQDVAATEDLTGQAHTDAATEAQAQADEYIAQGDYAAAAEAREVAENEAYEAGDYSMLGSSDSTDLENAAYKQDLAEDYRAQQAEHIADGDYEAAKEDAQNAGYEIGDADYLAGGTDHTGQADQDVYNLDNAVYDEKNADYFADNAEWYAEAGNADAAQSSLDNAAGYQESADAYAASADPVSPMYDVDPSSAVDVGGGYDMSAVDTGMDASTIDTSSSYDSGYDDGTV